MEDILASIRRILSEDEAPAAGATSAAVPPPAEPAGDGVLVLDPAMMVSEPPPAAPSAEPLPSPPPAACRVAGHAPRAPGLVAPEAAAAAASSVDSLVRTLCRSEPCGCTAAGPPSRTSCARNCGPLLKAWLDDNLPPLVERLVRAEIERVVGRAVP